MSSKRNNPDQTKSPGFDGTAGPFNHNVNMATAIFSPFLAANVSLLTWNANYCRQMAKAYSQWFDFIGHRLEADAAFAKELQQGNDPQKISKAYSVFLRTAAEDYKQEASELTRMTNQIADKATDALQDISIKKQSDGDRASVRD